MAFFVLRDLRTNLYEVVEASGRAALQTGYLQRGYRLATGSEFPTYGLAQRWVSAGGQQLTNALGGDYRAFGERPGVMDLAEGQAMLRRVLADESAAKTTERALPDATAESDSDLGRIGDKHAERDANKPSTEQGDPFRKSLIIPADEPRPIGESVFPKGKNLTPTEADRVREVFEAAERFVDVETTQAAKRTLDMLGDDQRTAPKPTQTDFGYLNNTGKPVFQRSTSPTGGNYFEPGPVPDSRMEPRTFEPKANTSVGSWSPAFGPDSGRLGLNPNKPRAYYNEETGELSYIKYQGRTFTSRASFKSFRQAEADLPERTSTPRDPQTDVFLRKTVQDWGVTNRDKGYGPRRSYKSLEETGLHLKASRDHIDRHNERALAQQAHAAEQRRLYAPEGGERKDSRSGFERPLEAGGAGPEGTWDVNPQRVQSWDFEAAIYKSKAGWTHHLDEPGATPWEHQQRTAPIEDIADPAGRMYTAETHYRTTSLYDAALIARQRSGSVTYTGSERTLYGVSIKPPVGGHQQATEILARALGADIQLLSTDPLQDIVERAEIYKQRMREQGQPTEWDTTPDSENRRYLNRVSRYALESATRNVVGARLTYDHDTSRSTSARPALQDAFEPGSRPQHMRITRPDGSVQEGYFTLENGEWVQTNRAHYEDSAAVILDRTTHKTAYISYGDDGGMRIVTESEKEANRIAEALKKRGHSLNARITREHAPVFDVKYYDKYYDLTGEAIERQARTAELGVYLEPERNLASTLEQVRPAPRSASSVASLAEMHAKVAAATQRTTAAVAYGASVEVTHTTGTVHQGPLTFGYTMQSRFTGTGAPQLGQQDAFRPLRGAPAAHYLSSDGPYQEVQPPYDPFVARPASGQARPLAGGISRSYPAGGGPTIEVGRGTMRVTVGDRVVFDNGFAPGPGDSAKGRPRQDVVGEVGTGGDVKITSARRMQEAAAAHLRARLSIGHETAHGPSLLETGARTILGSVPGSSWMTGHLGRAGLGYAAGAALGGLMGYSSPGLTRNDQMAAGAEGAMWGLMGMNPRAMAYGLRSHVGRQSRDQIDAALAATVVGFGLGTPVSMATEKVVARRVGPAAGHLAGFAAGAATWMAASFVSTVFLAMRNRAHEQAQTVGAAAVQSAADQALGFAEDAADAFEGLDLEFVDEAGAPLDVDIDADEYDLVGVEDEDGEELAFETSLS